LVNLLPGKVAASDTVAAGSLTLRLSLPRDLRVGDTVDVAIRPEDIRLGSDGVPARVEEQSYLGNLSEYHVALADGTRLRVQTAASADYPVGSTVSLEVDAAQCNVFRAE
jgi:iron(III) transport system ATP-binding protein